MGRLFWHEADAKWDATHCGSREGRVVPVLVTVLAGDAAPAGAEGAEGAGETMRTDAADIEQELRDMYRKALDRLAIVEVRSAKLQAFKDWTHSYLDTNDVPHHPPGTHGAAGCRIGDRMDWLMDRLAQAEKLRETCERERNQMVAINQQLQRELNEVREQRDRLLEGHR